MSQSPNDSLQAHFAARLKTAPNGRALGLVDSGGKLEWRTFEEFLDRSARCGSILAENGLGRGDVCVLVLQSEEFCATVLMGALLVGAIPLLVAPPVIGGLHSNLKDVVRHVIRKTGARVVVMGDDLRTMEDELLAASRGARVLFGEAAFKGGDAGAVPLAFPSATDLAALQLTSGTTGFPRVCMWEQRRVLASLDGMESAMRLASEDICVNWTPLYHDMGLVNNFLLCMVKGAPLVLLKTMDFVRKPALWLQVLSSSGATVTWSPNFGYAITAQRVRDHELEGVRLDRVRGYWSAAERIHLDTMLAFHQRFKSIGVTMQALKTNFGCAENVGGATFSDVDGRFVFEHVDRDRLYEKGFAQPAPESGKNSVSIVGVGRPYPGMTIKILSRIGRALADGHVGEIALDTPSRMNGYMRDAKSTKRALHGGLLRTGDFGYMRGQEVFWVGRVRERINIHGNKYDPSDFEHALLKVAGLREGCFAAFGVDDTRLGTQKVVVVVEVRDSIDRSHDAVMQDIRESIASRVGVTVNEVLLLRQGTMAKTSSGKRRHRFYRQMYVENRLEPVAVWGRR